MATPPPIPPKRSRVPWFIRLLIGMSCLFVLAIMLAVPEENWRGKHAWEKCRREFAARGESLDWKDYIPPPVPDNQNIFKAPHMTEWFVGRENHQFEQLLDSKPLPQFLAIEYPSSIVGDVTFVPLDCNLNQGGSSLLLRYEPPVLSLWTNSHAADQNVTILFSDLPLRKAIDLLAHNANLNYELTPPLDSPDFDRTNLVTGRWTNETAAQVLFLLLAKHNLGWRENPKTGLLSITKDPGQGSAYADPQTLAAIRNLIEKSLLPDGTEVQNPRLTGWAGLSFVRGQSNLLNHAHFVVQTSERHIGTSLGWFFTNAAVSESNQFSLVTNFPNPHSCSIVNESQCPAADYLKWSDNFEPQFTAIREALRRPYARRDGSYELALAAPIPNFTAFRCAAQTLARRAQCDLLLDKPQDALRELSLIHDLCRLSDDESTSKYGSLVAAMINAAVYHIYFEVVADGLHLHAWHDSQLVAIQKQLGEVNLCALAANAFRRDRAEMESVVETACERTTGDITPNSPLPHVPLLAKGLYHQNQIHIARLYQEVIDSFDLKNDKIRLDSINRFNEDTKRISAHVRPYTMVAAIAVPNFSKAVSTAASRQIGTDQARIACALERYRIAHGNIPDTLSPLAPQFIDKLPHDMMNGQALKYHRSTNDQFQLYSVGWNQTDDSSTTSTNLEQGDWVWPPAK